MSKKNDNSELWKDLAKGLEGVTIENTSDVEPDLLQAGVELKNFFDSFVKAGFTGEQAIRLLAEITVRGNNK